MPRKRSKLDARKLSPRTKRAEFSPFGDTDPLYDESFADVFNFEEESGAEERDTQEETRSQIERVRSQDLNRKKEIESRQERGVDISEDDQTFLSTYDENRRKSPGDLGYVGRSGKPDPSVYFDVPEEEKNEDGVDSDLAKPATLPRLEPGEPTEEGRPFPEYTHEVNPGYPTSEYMQAHMEELSKYQNALNNLGADVDLSKQNPGPPGGFYSVKDGLTPTEITHRGHNINNLLRKLKIPEDISNSIVSNTQKILKSEDRMPYDEAEQMVDQVSQFFTSSGMTTPDIIQNTQQLRNALHGTGVARENMDMQVALIQEAIKKYDSGTGKQADSDIINEIVDRKQKLFDRLGKASDLSHYIWYPETHLKNMAKDIPVPTTIPGFDQKQLETGPKLLGGLWELFIKAPDSHIPPTLKKQIHTLLTRSPEHYYASQDPDKGFKSRYDQVLNLLKNKFLAVSDESIIGSKRKISLSDELQNREARVLRKTQEHLIERLMNGRHDGEFAGTALTKKEAIHYLRNMPEGLKLFWDTIQERKNDLNQEDKLNGVRRFYDKDANRFVYERNDSRLIDPAKRAFLDQFESGVPEMMAIIEGRLPLTGYTTLERDKVIESIKKVMQSLKGKEESVMYPNPEGEGSIAKELSFDEVYNTETDEMDIVPKMHPLYLDLPSNQQPDFDRSLMQKRQKGKKYFPLGTHPQSLSLRLVNNLSFKKAEGPSKRDIFFNNLADISDALLGNDIIGETRRGLDKSIEKSEKDTRFAEEAAYMIHGDLTGNTTGRNWRVPANAQRVADDIYNDSSLSSLDKYEKLKDLRENRLKSPTEEEFTKEKFDVGYKPFMEYPNPETSPEIAKKKEEHFNKELKPSVYIKPPVPEDKPVKYQGTPNVHLLNKPTQTTKREAPDFPQQKKTDIEGEADVDNIAKMFEHLKLPNEDTPVSKSIEKPAPTPPEDDSEDEIFEKGGATYKRTLSLKGILRRSALSLRHKRADVYEDAITVTPQGQEIMTFVEETGGHDNIQTFQMVQILRDITNLPNEVTYQQLSDKYNAQFGYDIVNELFTAGYLGTTPMQAPEQPEQPEQLEQPEDELVQLPEEPSEQQQPEQPAEQSTKVHIGLTDEGEQKLQELLEDERNGISSDSGLLTVLKFVQDSIDAEYPLREYDEFVNIVQKLPGQPSNDTIDNAFGNNLHDIRYIRTFYDNEGQFKTLEPKKPLIEDRSHDVQNILNTGPSQQKNWDKLSPDERQFINNLRTGKDPMYQPEEGEEVEKPAGKIDKSFNKLVYDIAYPPKDEPELWDTPESTMARNLIEKGVIANPDLPGDYITGNPKNAPAIFNQGNPTKGPDWSAFQHFKSSGLSLKRQIKGDTTGPGGEDWTYEFTSGPTPTKDTKERRKHRFPMHNKPSGDLAIPGGSDQGNFVNNQPGAHNMDNLEATIRGMVKTADNELFAVHTFESPNNGPWVTYTVFQKAYAKFKKGDVVIQYGKTSSEINTIRRRLNSVKIAMDQRSTVLRPIIAVLNPGVQTPSDSFHDIQTGPSSGGGPYKKRNDYDNPENGPRDGFKRNKNRRKEDSERNVFPYEDSEISNQTQIFGSQKQAEVGNYAAPIVETPEERAGNIEQDYPKPLTMDPKRPFPNKRKRPTEKGETGISGEYRTQPKVEYI